MSKIATKSLKSCTSYGMAEDLSSTFESWLVGVSRLYRILLQPQKGLILVLITKRPCNFKLNITIIDEKRSPKAEPFSIKEHPESGHYAKLRCIR